MDIEEALLVKNFHQMAPPDDAVDKVMEEFFGGCLSDEDFKKDEERLNDAYGKQNAEDLVLYFESSNMVTAMLIGLEPFRIERELTSDPVPHGRGQLPADESAADEAARVSPLRRELRRPHPGLLNVDDYHPTEPERAAGRGPTRSSSPSSVRRWSSSPPASSSARELRLWGVTPGGLRRPLRPAELEGRRPGSRRPQPVN